jgi:SNF2 family DNA or RNA helicase
VLNVECENRHQEIAHAYILQSAIGAVPPDMSLWKLHNDGLSKPLYVDKFTIQLTVRYLFWFFATRYEHVVTGLRRSSPGQETFGGLLADEMGMGKTLSMLSAIVSTLDCAQKFAESKDSEFSELCKPFSGTLVIVPSVCNF